MLSVRAKNSPLSKIAALSTIHVIEMLCAAAIVIALVGCQGADRNTKIDPEWNGLIVAHTTGPISRKSPLRVVFARDVIAAEQVGKPVKILHTDPAVDARVVFESPRELALVPRTELKAGQTYRVSLSSQGLLGVTKLSDYVFNVQVQSPQFDIRFDGLMTNIGHEDEMSLRGELATADSENSQQVEKILTASYAEKPARIEWQHANSGLLHTFTITTRKPDEQEKILALTWDGASIGADITGHRSFTVPAKKQFALTQAIAVNDTSNATERHIALYFSDALDAKQDLRGLVRIGDANAPRLRVDGNVLRVYVSEKLVGDVQIIVDAGLRSLRGATLNKTETQTVSFAIEKPQVRWVGNGVILPEESDTPLAVPFEAVNLRSVQVTAFRVYADNLPQFMQVNPFDGQRELTRVGRYLWRKTIRLTADQNAVANGRWTRYSLDLSELMHKQPGDLVRLQLSFSRRDIVGDCAAPRDREVEPVPKDAETGEQADASMWDYVQYAYDEDGEVYKWNERDDPCKPAYYRYAQNTRAARNFIVSNFGLVAKRDQHGELLIAATDLRSAEPLSGAKLSVFNFQNQLIGGTTTGINGLAKLKTSAAPFLLVAEKDNRKGYLKLAPGVALTVSHFDVGGEKVAAGIKATIYGERGVWRPGDPIYLTFVVQDSSHSLPPNHPVTMELFNSQRQLVQTMVNDKPVGNFYAFTMQTAADAPTGDWIAKATLGANSFSKTLKIETVMPNRLKIDLAMNPLEASKPLHGELSSQWLAGAAAANLRADVKLKLTKSTTTFTRFADFVFDDPAREFAVEPETLFDGDLDAEGHAVIDKAVSIDKQAPGMLNALLTTRVFERSGAFSINRQTTTLSPYEKYVGLKLPKGDVARNMLLTDTPHVVEIASVNSDGDPVSIDEVAITVFKIDWRWWWDQSGESLAQYVNATHARVVQSGIAKTSNGSGQWSFIVKYPEWGRYLIRACDVSGGHCTGRAFYIDWPSWAGRPQDQSGPGANALAITADKNDYRVGETAHIDLPEGSQGRALLTIENGSRILDARWLDVKEGARRMDIALNESMTPNVYASVTLLQPHANKNNDRPIRMYGIVPLKVSDPHTVLHPILATDKEWKPESNVIVQVSERDHRPMSYTLAIVDEGLLGLTNFKTPSLHEFFYQRESLGITTWDLFDQVVGSYGANLERLLALGGSDRTESDPEKDKSRFPPVVRFVGPFSLNAGTSAKHEIKLPQYVGAVRVMLIAGHEGSYGSIEQTVPVRQPLMILPTLPRVIGPDEEIAVPISVFANEPGIRSANVSIEVDDHFEIVGEKSTTVKFLQPSEQLAILHLKTLPRIGKAHVVFAATSAPHSARAEIYIDVRSSNPTTVAFQTKTLQPGEVWKTPIKPHGLLGTNVVSLEMSAVPPLNLERRLDYLIHYPYGCVEQTTSSVFPQLYLPALVKLDLAQQREIEANVKAGIDHLQSFQQGNGAFAYWPGGWLYENTQSSIDPRLGWSTTYVGHFLLEADRLGYRVPEAMLKNWLRYQRSAAQSWQNGIDPRNSSRALDQAYRLFTLALANQAEIGAMNRLREVNSLVTPARWMLAAAYKLAGLADAAETLVKDNRLQFSDYEIVDETFGSRLRDTAIVLNAELILGKQDTKSLVDAISNELIADRWYSTQSLAYSLLAMSKFVGASQVGAYTFEASYADSHTKIESKTPLYREVLAKFPEAGGDVEIKNTSSRTLFASVIERGVPRAGQDTAASSGLSVDVVYNNVDGGDIDIAHVKSGTDLIARVTVKNNEVFDIKNIALTHIVPAGFEIHNDRMDGVVPTGERSQPREEPWYWRALRNERKAERIDIRDDRIYSYFALNAGERITFVAHLNAAYVGRYYLPSISAEAMYDASKYARTQGQWVEVLKR